MDEFEKVEKLVSRTNVTYEEAKEALNAVGGDILDAMIYLEKQGKVEKPAAEERTTRAEENLPSAPVIMKDKKDAKKFWEKVKEFMAKAWEKGNNNNFIIDHKNENVLTIPVWVFVVVILLTWHITLPLMIISLFFNCRYHFEGKDDLSSVNNAMDQVGDVADSIKEGFNNSNKQ